MSIKSRFLKFFSPLLKNLSILKQFQGINRLERGRNFKSNIDLAYPENKHALITNPDIAHNEWGMYSSVLGRKLLFSH